MKKLEAMKVFLAGVAVTIVFALTVFGSYQVSLHAQDSLDKFKAQVCQLSQGSVKTDLFLKHQLNFLAGRATLRARVDAANGDTAAAQADRDTATIERLEAKLFQKPKSFLGC